MIVGDGAGGRRRIPAEWSVADEQPCFTLPHPVWNQRQAAFIHGGPSVGRARSTGEQIAAFSAPLFNPKNCSISADATAAITIVRGTRAYAGVTGDVTMAAKSGGVLPKTHGKRSKCTTKTSTAPLTTYSSIIGSGTVTVP